MLACLLFCPVQCVSGLALLTFFAARSRRSRT
ncbi:putative membrane protein, partial [Escherichia coli 2-222-05_S4_C3]